MKKIKVVQTYICKKCGSPNTSYSCHTHSHYCDDCNRGAVYKPAVLVEDLEELLHKYFIWQLMKLERGKESIYSPNKFLREQGLELEKEEKKNGKD